MYALENSSFQKLPTHVSIKDFATIQDTYHKCLEREKERERKKKKPKPNEIPKPKHFLVSSAITFIHSPPWEANQLYRSPSTPPQLQKLPTTNANYYPNTYLWLVLIQESDLLIFFKNHQPLDLDRVVASNASGCFLGC